jgi:sec-independent protein translocase protein TatB
MFNLDPAKLLVIAVVAILLLGPDKLPQVARQVGGAWRSLNEFRHRMETEVRSNIPDLPSSNDIARLARSPSALLNHLSNMSPDGSNSPTTAEGGETAEGADGAGADVVPDVVPDGAPITYPPAPLPADPLASHVPAPTPSTNGTASAAAAAAPAPTPAPATNGATASATPSPPAQQPQPHPPDVTVPGDPSLN